MIKITKKLIVLAAVSAVVPIIYETWTFWFPSAQATPLPQTEAGGSIVLAGNLEHDVITQYIKKVNNQLPIEEVEKIYGAIADEPLKFTIIGISKVESNFDAQAFSTKPAIAHGKLVRLKNGTIKREPLAIGLNGINVNGIDELVKAGVITSEEDLWTVKGNDDACVYWYIKYLMRAKGNPKLALQYYFAGPNNVRNKKLNRSDYEKYAVAVLHVVAVLTTKVDVEKMKEASNPFLVEVRGHPDALTQNTPTRSPSADVHYMHAMGF